MPDFEQARQKNLAYGVTYGAHMNVHAPHWTGSEGDLVAQTRMAWPSPGVQRYFSGPNYNQFARNYLLTALQGEGRRMSDATKLQGQDDYTPSIGRVKYAQASQYPDMASGAQSEKDETNEILLVGIVVVGLVGLLFLLQNGSR